MRKILVAVATVFLVVMGASPAMASNGVTNFNVSLDKDSGIATVTYRVASPAKHCREYNPSWNDYRVVGRVCPAQAKRNPLSSYVMAHYAFWAAAVNNSNIPTPLSVKGTTFTVKLNPKVQNVILLSSPVGQYRYTIYRTAWR